MKKKAIVFLVTTALLSNTYAANASSSQNASEILAFINARLSNIKVRQCLVETGTKRWEKSKFIKNTFKLDQGLLSIDTLHGQESCPHGKLFFEDSHFEVPLKSLALPFHVTKPAWEYPKYYDAECPGFTALPAFITLSCHGENNCIRVTNGNEPLENINSLKIFIHEEDGIVITKAITDLINLNKVKK